MFQTDFVLGQVHKYLPERAKIPAKVQKGKGGRHSKRGTVFVRRRFTKFDFPDIPDGFKPKGEERAVVVPEKVECIVLSRLMVHIFLQIRSLK